jgi:hypothetical protein
MMTRRQSSAPPTGKGTIAGRAANRATKLALTYEPGAYAIVVGDVERIAEEVVQLAVRDLKGRTIVA